MAKKIDWKQELLDSATFNQNKERLLMKSTSSLIHSWLLGVLYTRWKKLKGIRKQPSPDSSSSFQEWNKKLRM